MSVMCLSVGSQMSENVSLGYQVPFNNCMSERVELRHPPAKMIGEDETI